MVMLDRGDYWQCAYVIPKAGIERVKSEGIEAFASGSSRCRRFWPIGEFENLDDVKLLERGTAEMGRRLGLICIGDAAHAMSPIGGVGVNMAVQDAVAAATSAARSATAW